jgi:dTDP-4-amino-4,6-dideoxygalactose transaminase
MNLRCITSLDFDTEALGVKTGKLSSADCPAESLPRAVEGASRESFELLYWSMPIQSDSSPANILACVPGYLVSVNVELELDVDREHSSTSPSPSMKIEEASIEKKTEVAAIVSLALISGEKSRFKCDPSLTDYQYRKVYTQWAHNCLHYRAADAVFVSHIKDNPAGMITLEIRGEVATIGLLAVFPGFQRQGVGTSLLRHAVRWARKKGAGTLKVTTQRINSGALGLYRSFGFAPASRVAMYHIWPSHAVRVKQNVPYFAGREIDYLTDLTQSRNIESCGKYTSLCCEKLKDLLQCPHAILTGSATAALEQAMILCDIGPGDEVIIPSYTFVSTANAVVLRGGTPVFVDVGADCQIDPTRVEEAITPKTKCIIVVHYAGQACDMNAIMSIAKKYEILVVEDAAQGLLSTYKDRFLGTIGHIGCISFHYTKNTICGEGGALLVNHEPLRERSYVVWEKGTNRFDFVQKRVDKYHWIDIGSSFVPSELCASFLYSQLEVAEYCQARRLAVSSLYRRFLLGLAQAGHIDMMPQSLENAENGHIFWVTLSSPSAKKELQEYMKRRDVQLFEHYCPLHSSPGGMRYGRCHGTMAVTDKVSSCLLRLPTYVQMNFTHVFAVVQGIHEYFRAAPPSLNEIMLAFLEGRQGVPA